MGRQLFGVLLDFPDRSYDFLHVALVPQQRWLRNPHRFPRRSLGMRKRLPQKAMICLGLRPAQTLAILSVAEHVQIVQRRVARLVRNTLGIDRRNEALGRDAGELFAVEMKDIRILPMASAAFVKFLRRDTRDLAEIAIQHSGVLMTPPGLLIQTTQLRQQDGSLPFADTIVRAVTEMAVKPFARQTSAVVDRSRLALKSIIVGNDNAAFAGCYLFCSL